MSAAVLAARRAEPPHAPALLLSFALALVAALYVAVATIGRWMPVELPASAQARVVGMRILPPLQDPPVLDGLRARSLATVFARYNYRLDTLRQGLAGVPPLQVTRLPRDMAALEVEERKRLFLRAVLPLVLSANEAILEDRRRLRAIADLQAQGQPVPLAERDWLRRLAERYRLAEPDVSRLLPRVDVVPPSLALAQAATESGWGTSRFAREGNALFGQWTWSEEDGIRPRQAPPDADYRVRKFDSLQGAVQAYMLNLNTHPAYAEFRRRRAAMRAAGQPIDGAALARTLHAYSERGEEYITDLLTIIRVNRLRPLDGARLQIAEVPPPAL